MRYLPHTREDIASMLKTVGVGSLDDLFNTIPDDCCCRAPLDLPQPLNEWELKALMGSMADKIAAAPDYKLFVGAGRYDHYIPESVSYLVGRSEFATSYTPYQPEMSQGTLQAIYEYQTLAARLLGMEVANASLYDGASALAEAMLMSVRITRRKTVAISSLIHPFYRQVVRTYMEPSGCNVIVLPYRGNGTTELSELESRKDVAAVAIQSPNFFGCIEDLEAVQKVTRANESLLVATFTEPLAFGLLKNPGSQGADIACGEGQSFGIPAAFGGPGLGVFTSKMKYVRSMPGRLVGKTVDQEGQRGFVLTLATREQHIRREKATSNICTNQSLCALTAAVYMASVGGTGIRKLARFNYDKSEYLKAELQKAGFRLGFESPTFNEFVVVAPDGFATGHKRLLDQKIMAGLPLAPYYPELADHYLMCVTETKTKEDMDALIKAIGRAGSN